MERGIIMRLTNKYGHPTKGHAIYEQQYKLRDLEDIEDELGIDLVTLISALKNGIWIYDTNGLKMFTGHFKNGLVFNYCSQPSIQYIDRLFYLKDYGKTWALEEALL